MSILSYPNRGKWGKSSWRGNCSGFIIKDLLNFLKPNSFCDPMMGSGTSIEVAKEMGVEAHGLDLHSGFNILRDSILGAIGQPVDLCFSHPAYHDMVVYSGNVWGKEAHPDDLSRCSSNEDFMEKLHVAMINQREATKDGGFYGILIGDLRRKGKYYSYQAEAISRMPQDELRSVIIKAQHNCVSDTRQYARMQLPRIMHEYLILWQKPEIAHSFLSALSIMAGQQQNRLTSTWKAVVRNALIQLGGEAPLADLYRTIAQNSPERLANNKNWEARVRHVVQKCDEYKRIEKGVWGFAA